MEFKGHSHEQWDPKTYPEWVRGPYRVCRRRLENEARLLHLTVQGLSHVQKLPSLMDLFNNPKLELGLERDPPYEVNMRERAQKNADWVEKEAASGFPLLHAHSLDELYGEPRV